MSILSLAEKRLFAELHMEDLTKLVETCNLSAPAAYDIAALKCFQGNASGKAVEALRRGRKEIVTGGFNRSTSEFDAVIKF